MAMSSKAEKLLTTSSTELRLLNPNNNGSISFKFPAPSHARRSTKSFDLDNGADTFFDCEEPGPASVSEDVFYNFTTPCWSSYGSESAIIGMGSPPPPTKNTTLHTKESPSDSNSDEKNLSHFFFQDHFWNHDYKHVDHHHRHRNKAVTVEDNTKLVQFLEDSYWVHQADAGAGSHQKSKSFPCIPCIACRKSKGKPPSAVSVSVSVSTQHYVPQNDNSKPRKTNMAKTSSCSNCLPISFSWLRWLRFKGRKKLSHAPIQD